MKDLLPYCRAASLPEVNDEARWLVDGLWMEEGVGIVGGAPKCCKSWLGLDLALSVASGTPCLTRYRVQHPGNVLCYLAEDASAVVKSRLQGICRSRALRLEQLPMDLITAPALRLDEPLDQDRLSNTVRALAPRLLLLDPFVRLHRLDENDAGQVSGVLAFLRALQREHHLSVVVVHHARKNAQGAVAGQTLRGSSDFHAWGDSNLYLRRRGDTLLLTVEHRAAPAPEGLLVHLATDPMPHLVASDSPPVTDRPMQADTLPAKVLAVLTHAREPMTRAALRSALHVRNASLGDALTALMTERAIARQGDAWSVCAKPIPVPAP